METDVKLQNAYIDRADKRATASQIADVYNSGMKGTKLALYFPSVSVRIVYTMSYITYIRI